MKDLSIQIAPKFLFREDMLFRFGHARITAFDGSMTHHVRHLFLFGVYVLTVRYNTKGFGL